MAKAAKDGQSKSLAMLEKEIEILVASQLEMKAALKRVRVAYVGEDAADAIRRLRADLAARDEDVRAQGKRIGAMEQSASGVLEALEEGTAHQNAVSDVYASLLYVGAAGAGAGAAGGGAALTLLTTAGTRSSTSASRRPCARGSSGPSPRP